MARNENNYELHPAALVFPAMADADYRAMVEDIRINGQHDAILLLDGLVIDGRHRLEACHELGIKPIVSELPSGSDPYAVAISRNLHRRHLTTSQRAMIAAQMATLKRGDAKSQLDDPQNCGSKTEDAAALLNVSPRSVEAAKQVLASGNAEVISAVTSGQMSVSNAAKKVKPAKPKLPKPAAEKASVPADAPIEPTPLEQLLAAIDRIDFKDLKPGEVVKIAGKLSVQFGRAPSFNHIGWLMDVRVYGIQAVYSAVLNAEISHLEGVRITYRSHAEQQKALDELLEKKQKARAEEALSNASDPAKKPEASMNEFLRWLATLDVAKRQEQLECYIQNINSSNRPDEKVWLRWTYQQFSPEEKQLLHEELAKSRAMKSGMLPGMY